MMHIHFPRFAPLTLALLLWCAAVGHGSSYPPKTNNRIVCLNLQTGELIWEHVPEKLSDAHFEWYPEGVVAFPHYSGGDRSEPMFLEAATGKPREAFEMDAEKLLGKSAVFWPGPEVKLENGWQLTGYSPGNTKTLALEDARLRRRRGETGLANRHRRLSPPGAFVEKLRLLRLQLPEQRGCALRLPRRR